MDAQESYFEQFTGEDVRPLESIIVIKGIKPEEVEAALEEWRKTFGWLYPPPFIQEIKVVDK